MLCLRCGREIEEDQVFCPQCESDMEKHPVKPNTVVTIPERTARRRSAPVRTPAQPEEDTTHLHRTILQLRLWVCMLMAVLLLCVGVLTWQVNDSESSAAEKYKFISSITYYSARPSYIHRVVV